jgi:hypothetical protein
MSKNLKLILISVAIVIVFALLVVYIINVRKSSVATPPAQQPSSQLPSVKFVIPSESSSKMTIPTKDAGQIETNNIYIHPAGNLSNNGVGFISNDDYFMAFYPNDKSFTITIQSINLEEARRRAEAAFLQALGITQDQACRLNVSLYVPDFVSSKNSGQDFGLSFCPNGKPLN